MDKGKQFEKLKEGLQVARPKKKRKLMWVAIPIGRDNMETLFEQHKLHNQGQKLAEGEKALEVPQGDNVPKNPIIGNEGERDSTQNSLPIPKDLFSKLEIFKMA